MSEELKALEMSDASYKRLIDEWKDIIQKESQSNNDTKSVKVSEVQLKVTLKARKEDCKDIEKKCLVLEKKIKELHLSKKNQQRAILKKKQDIEKQLGEEDWDSRFDEASRRSSKNLFANGRKSMKVVKTESSLQEKSQVDETKEEEPEKKEEDQENKDEPQNEEQDEKKEEVPEEQQEPDAEKDLNVVDSTKDKEKAKEAKKNYDADQMYNSNPDRSEIIIGQIYNKKFETLFDDQSAFIGYTPHSIIKIQCNWNDQNIVGLKFHYMTTQGHIIEGRF